MSVRKQLEKIMIDEAVKIEVVDRQRYIQDITRLYQAIAMDLNAVYMAFLTDFSTNTDEDEDNG